MFTSPNLLRMKKRGEHGFTLIELLVVVIIIAILAAIAVPVYIGIQNNAKKSAIDSDVSTTKTNVAAVLTEDATIPTGTYVDDNSAGSVTKAGSANIQNSHSPSDESVTVAVQPGPNGAPQVTVVGYSPSLDYSFYTDPGTNNTTAGKAADGTAAIAAAQNGSTSGTTSGTTAAPAGFKLCNPGSTTNCIQISKTATQMGLYSPSFGGGPVYAEQVTQTGAFGLTQDASNSGQTLYYVRSDVPGQLYGAPLQSAAHLDSYGFYSGIPDGTYWLQIDQGIMDKATCFSLSSTGCDLTTGQPTTTDGSASAR